MPNQGLVALGALAVVIVGGAIIWVGLNAWLKSEPKARRQPPKPFPTGARAEDPNDRVMYDKINRLAAFFAAQMRGRSIALNPRRPNWAPSSTMRQLQPSATALPLEITIDRAWWGGPNGYCCITPSGQWEYQGTCEAYREGTNNEFNAWWVVSSARFKQSVAVRDPYPFVLYLVLDPGTATLAHALQVMGDMMEQLLTRYRPGAVAEFRRLRHQGHAHQDYQARAIRLAREQGLAPGDTVFVPNNEDRVVPLSRINNALRHKHAGGWMIRHEGRVIKVASVFADDDLLSIPNSRFRAA